MFIGNKKCRIYAACGVSQTPIEEQKKRGALIIIACHDKEELEMLSDEIIEIYEGRIVAKEKA